MFEPENSPPSDLPPDPLVDWVSRKNPEEVLVEDPSLLSSFAHFQGASVKREQQEGWRDFLPVSFRMPELAPQSLKALSMLVGYVAWHQKSILPHLTGVVLENDSGNLVLDRSSLRHLDLFPFGEEKRNPAVCLKFWIAPEPPWDHEHCVDGFFPPMRQGAGLPSVIPSRGTFPIIPAF